MIFLRHLAPSTRTEELREIGVKKSKELVNNATPRRLSKFTRFPLRGWPVAVSKVFT